MPAGTLTTLGSFITIINDNTLSSSGSSVTALTAAS